MTILLQMLVSAALLVLIWLIQLLHYPMFKFVDEEKFPEAMQFHQRAISFIVIPLMIAELILALYLINLPILMIVVAIWVSTFTLQVPLHQKLTHKKDFEAVAYLVNSNWIRTFLWSLKFVMVILSYPG